MPNVFIRRLSVIIAVLIIALSFMLNKYLSGMKKQPDQRGSFATTPIVKAKKVTNETIQLSIPLTGKLVSKNKIEVFPEVTAKLMQGAKPFKEGTSFGKGQLMLKLDDTDYRMGLTASRANFQSQVVQLLVDLKMDYPDNFDTWKNYTNDFNPENSIPELPEVKSAQEKGLLVGRNIFNMYFNIKSQEAQLKKYRIYAPFSGIVGSANVNPGSVVRAGQKVGEFIDPYLFELEVGLHVQDADKVKPGSIVELSSNEIEGSWKGKVKRISQGVDANTQTLKAYIEIYSRDLYEGLYLNAKIGGRKVANVTTVSSNLIKNDGTVYLISGEELKKQEVKVLHEEGDDVIVQGIPDGSILLNQVLSGAKDGLRVKLAE